MHKDIRAYNNAQTKTDKKICNLLSSEIERQLPDAENKTIAQSLVPAIRLHAEKLGA